MYPMSMRFRICLKRVEYPIPAAECARRYMDDNDPASGTDHDGRRILLFYADEPPEWREATPRQ